jgi:hypothetical protein
MTVNHGVPGSSPGEGAKAICIRWLFLVYVPLYFIFSELNRYYKGVSDHPEQRLMEHNTAIKTSAYTAVTNDWELIFQLKCESKSHLYQVAFLVYRN